MKIDLGDINQNSEFGCLCASSQQLKIGLVICNIAAAIDSQGVIPAWDQEQQPQFGIVDDVPHAISNPVSGPFWKQQGGIIQAVDEARRITPRGGIAAVAGGSGKQAKRTSFNEVFAVPFQLGNFFYRRVR